MKLSSFLFNLNSRRPPQGKQVHSELPFDAAFEQAIDVLKKMKITIGQADRNSGSITAYKGWSTRSDGEVIRLSIKPSETTPGCDISIQSESAARTFDMGVNDANVEQFERLFREMEGRPGGAG